MKRVSTIKRDLQNAVADLELAASELEDRPGFVPGRTTEVRRLRSVAGAISQALNLLP